MRILITFIVWSAVLVTAQQTTPAPEALFEAARTGDRPQVEALLDRGVDVNARSRYGITAVGFAAGKGHVEIVRLLAARGADLNVPDSFYGSRPVDLALRDGHIDVAIYLVSRGAQGATALLTAGIRRQHEVAVQTALAADQLDGGALATASALAVKSGNTRIAERVKAAAAKKPAVAPQRIALDATLLRSYEGQYVNASTGAAIALTFANGALTLSADGQPTLQLSPIEERRFVADNSPEVTVTLGGRGGIIERLSIARGDAAVRYDREGYADATSPAALRAPAVTPRRSTATAASDPTVAPRSAPKPWPAFRGANASGSADGQGAVADWDVATGRNVRWKVRIPGLATSSPIIWGNRIIVAAAASDADTSFRTGLYGDVKPVDDASRHSFRVYALDHKSGKILWDREVYSGVPATKRHTKSSQANSTPVTDGRHIVTVFGAAGLIVCHDMDGTLLWKKDIGAIDSGWFLDASYQWGHSSSPIIYKSSVIVQADHSKGSFLASFDLATGRELWRTARADEVSTWATPTVLTAVGGDELVTNGTKVRGYDPRTGALLWTLSPNSEIAIGTPVVDDNVAYVTAGYPPVRPVYAVKAGARGDISLPPGQTSSSAIAWSHDRDGTYISTPIVYRGQLYTLNNNGILTAYDAQTGERIYRARVGGGGAFSASPVAADGRLYIASEDGDVFVVKTGREYLEERKITMGEVTMATPAISDGLIVVRTLHHVWAIGQ